MGALMNARLRLSVLSVALIFTVAGVPARAQQVCIENAGISELRDALLSGRISAGELTRAYLARIAVYDRAGPGLNAVREINPEALAIAEKLDASKPDPRLPL